MAGNLTDVPRTEKLAIARDILSGLKNRQQSGPPEPALDDFIPELAAVVAALETRSIAYERPDPARVMRLARADAADAELDTWVRHIESYLHIEASRRSGSNIGVARALYTAACPDGLAHIDTRIVDENAYCRETLGILKDPENAAAIAAIELPARWISKLEAALAESEAAVADVIAERGEESAQGSPTRGGEDEWIDLMLRLRTHLGSRATRADFVKLAESRALLRPLIDTLQRLRVDAASRATKRTVKIPRPTY